jgi:hypothetical protein
MVAHVYNPNTQEAEAEESGVQCQPELHSEPHLKKAQNNNNKFLLYIFSSIR